MGRSMLRRGLTRIELQEIFSASMAFVCVDDGETDTIRYFMKEENEKWS